MLVKSFKINGLEQLEKTVPQILAQLHCKVVLLKGDLGAGKTTLVKYLLTLLGVQTTITSPTYALINEYKTTGLEIAHMDLYRLQSVDEALDIGIEDYLDDFDFCFIEWPDIIGDLLPSKYQQIDITTVPSDGTRVFDITTMIHE